MKTLARFVNNVIISARKDKIESLLIASCEGNLSLVMGGNKEILISMMVNAFMESVEFREVFIKSLQIIRENEDSVKEVTSEEDYANMLIDRFVANKKAGILDKEFLESSCDEFRKYFNEVFPTLKDRGNEVLSRFLDKEVTKSMTFEDLLLQAKVIYNSEKDMMESFMNIVSSIDRS